jgi:pyruvate, water dikinase
MKHLPNVVLFKDVSKEDIGLVGGKGANLGEMTRAGIPVPSGFIVTSAAYFRFLDENNLREFIKETLHEIDIENPEELDSVSKKIQRKLETSPIPKAVSDDIIKSYLKLGSIWRTAPVAVRSSATAEDLPDASFAGQQESYLNVNGEANVVERVRSCWASLFGGRAIYYRQRKKFDHFKVGIAVPVQKMVNSEISGVMFTIDPVSGNKNYLIIEAAWGYGDYIVQGVVTPDHYEVYKDEMKIIRKDLAKQTIMEVKANHEVKKVSVPKSKQEKLKLKDDQIIELGKIGLKIHHHYYFPQDIEWAYEKGKFYITQTRPITTIKLSEEAQHKNQIPEELLDKLPVILTGSPASPGIVSGPVKILTSSKEINKISPGDILVAHMTSPDYVPAMRKAAAIVTNAGGQTSHAAIVSRELGVPCVVGTTQATKLLSNGMVITVNGSKGEVYKGAPTGKKVELRQDTHPLPPPISESGEPLKTATRLYVNLAEPQNAYEIAKKNVDGVGLLRAEFMIADIGVHPKKMIADGKKKEFIEKLSEGMATFCQAFYPRPVIYRATDFKTNEYRNLKGGEAYEPIESNPMLGFRGAYRYIKTPEVFDLELEAIKHVRNKLNLKNIWLMIPFVSTVKELEEVKKLVTTSGLSRSPSFKLWMMVEIPANVILLEEFLNVGIDGVSIGSNDLTMLILGVDRDNSEVAPIFNELNPAVLWALEKTIKTCHKMKVTCGICGQAPSQYPELVEKLVDWGITSISVNPDAIDHTRGVVSHVEKRLVRSR